MSMAYHRPAGGRRQAGSYEVVRFRAGTELAGYLSGEVEGEHVVRLDPLRRRTTLFPLLSSPFPRTETSITIDLKRQDVTVRPDPRVLVRKADVFGMPPRSRQRSREAERRTTSGDVEAKVLVRL